MEDEMRKIHVVAASSLNKTGLKLAKKNLEEAFPDVEPGFKPLGSRLIVQIRTPSPKVGSILLTDEIQEVELWNTQIAKVKEIGPLSFKDRGTLEQWPEGAWVAVGDYVRIPKYNQDKWFIEYETNKLDGNNNKIKAKALFMLINDLDVLAVNVGDPLSIKAYI